MFLACDIGNSNIKAGLFTDDNIIETFLLNNIEELEALYSERDISRTGISSVVPLKSALLIKFLNSKKFPFYEVTPKSNPGFNISYKTPETLGIDRICSAAGAWYLNGEMKKNEAIISIDFGTATTVNVILYPGNFVGGIIAPGIPLMSRSLHANTAQLPEVNVDDYGNFIGQTTKESIASGLVNYTIGMIDRTINHLKKEYTIEVIKIFTTGGNAEKILQYFNHDFVYEKNLVLWGIFKIVSLNSFIFL
jgi:type III pantothenate kinase